MQREIDKLRKDFLKPANQVHDQSLLSRGFPEEEPEDATLIWLMGQLKLLKIREPEEIIIRDNHAGWIKIRFGGMQERDDVMKKLMKPSFKFNGNRIWVDKDLPYEGRQLINCLLAIRKDLAERELIKDKLWLDKDSFTLYYYDDKIISFSVCDGMLQFDVGKDWMEYLCKGKLEEIKQAYEAKLTKGNGQRKETCQQH